jgi:ribose transport system ATP-binding protein
MAVYMGLQGATFLLRDHPDGYINSTVSDWITWRTGPFPVSFIVLAAVAMFGEYALRKSRPGWQHRAIGSSEESARRIGIRINRNFVLGYVICSTLTACGAVLLMAEWGTGDPRQGAPLTLASITAVVLGGTSLRGGRGTFIGSVLGAILLSEVLKAVVFLDLTQTYQYVFQGVLVVAAALTYSIVRARAAS